MTIALIGGAGFIGTNLAINLCKENDVTIIDREEFFFESLKSLKLPISYVCAPFSLDADFDEQVAGKDVIYHLASTTIPGNSNIDISMELEANVIVTCKLLDACVRQNVKKIVFISSGGAVYGKNGNCPVEENMVTYPISSYGIQKIAIEKLLYLYRYRNGLDYRIIRLANPYGPYQRPDGKLGVVTTFIYKALTDGIVEVFGNGSIVRDFIYIDDAVRGINNIVNGESDFRVFNLGSGKGTSINEVIDCIRKCVNHDLIVNYVQSRATDVPVNYLDMGRYEKLHGNLNPMKLQYGIEKTADFLVKEYKLYLR